MGLIDGVLNKALSGRKYTLGGKKVDDGGVEEAGPKKLAVAATS